MKPKSPKIKLLVTLYALLKFSDKDHRMSSPKVNKLLEPFDIKTSGRSLGDTAAVLKELGVDVRTKGTWDNFGLWIENRPLPTDKLKELIFAISTNPHITKEKADELLATLSPFVTVYQEPLLKSIVENVPQLNVDKELIEKYMVINEAINSEKRVYYRLSYLKYDKKTKELNEISEWPTLFTPKYIYQKNNKLIMFGYNNTDKKLDLVDLENISFIKIAFKKNDPLGDEVKQILKRIDIDKNAHSEGVSMIYKGPAIFKCRGQYANNIYRMFGPPSDSVEKNSRSITIYPLECVEIWPETLLELASIPNKGVRIEGPKELTEAVSNYYKDMILSM